MDVDNAYHKFPGMSAPEFAMLKQTTAHLSETQAAYFWNIYSSKRRAPENVKLYCIASFFIPGLQRFMLGQVAWGVMYFFTSGFFFVMTVMDLINYQELALEYNGDAAYEAFQLTQHPFGTVA